MKRSYTGKMVLIIVIVALSILGLYSKPIRRGIDLRGGAELLFRIDTDKAESQQLATLTEDTVNIIRERVDPMGKEGLIIQARDQFRILMQLPGFKREKTKEIISLATNMGKLQWRLVVEDSKQEGYLKAGGKLPGYAYFPYNENARKTMQERARKFGSSEVIPEGLVVRVDDGYNMTGELIARLSKGMDETGAPAVDFTLKQEGARVFSKLTGDHRDERLAIILNDEIFSAPVIRSRIVGRGQITGGFNAAEQESLVRVLKAGSLKAPLILESEQYVGPTLGAVTIESGVRAGLIAGICVLAFILVYYMVVGAVANIALVLNILILLGALAVFSATLTLPGIAGIILTVGMAVDANVLIFERIREELRLGRELSVAIRMGYEKAFSAIFDSNLTTFATALILYLAGTGPVKGFAVTLSIGILASFFTAVFVTRVIIELLVKHGILKKITMLHILTRTNLNFLSFSRVTFALSFVAIVTGMWLFTSRGMENLDIDFTGGSVAHLELTRELSVDEVRQRVADAGFPAAKIQTLAAQVRDMEAGEEVSGGASAGMLKSSTRFALRVQLREGKALADFEAAMADAFADSAHTRQVSFDVTRTRTIRARNDSLFGGVRVEGKLGEELSAAKIAEAVGGLGLERFELKLYRMNETTGALDSLGEDAEAVGIIAVTALGVEEEALAEKLRAAFGVPNPFPEQVSQIGSQVAGEMKWDAVIAIGGAMIFIVAYIWVRFGRLRYGFAAVVALAHDVLITLSALAVAAALAGTPVGRALLLGDFKINLGVVAALLTIVGYSLNDTIVVFDRIRENMRLKTKGDWEIITGSINQTLSRTILTSLTTIMVLVIMYVFGGPGIHSFAFVMLVGVLTGTYSSIFIASPLLLFKEVLGGKPIAERAK